MNITDKIALYQEFIKKCTSSEGSWSNYSQFSRIDKLIKAIHPDYSDLIYYSDPKFVRNLYQELLSLEKLPTEETKDTFKTLGGGQYHNAMATYIRFLEAVKILSHVDMSISQFSPQEKPAFQIIYYGAPGTGKSHRIKKELKEMNVSKENIFRTTFHPDSDYSSFVGCYKPTMKPVDEKYRNVVGKDEEIAYSFVPQTFIKAYTQAYKNPNENVYLIIEEINRGNCAQIFGDLFQLLDRDDNGVSEYPIKADSDLKMYLEGELGKNHDGIKDGELCLPSNLYIWATMNTSDQSLFPIDSAFKRRWDWEYEPIKYMNTDWGIEVGGNMYSWTSFQKEVNNRIFDATNSEDKMLGDFFVKPNNNVISEKQFINKVLFYLWNDVCKDGDGDIFKTEDNKNVKFSDLYDTNASVTLKSMMKNLGVALMFEGNGITENEVSDETAKKQRKETLISIQIPNNPKILTSDSTQFDAFVQALRIIGIDRIISVLPSLKYQRLGCPVLSTDQDDRIINNNDGYSYYQEGNLFIVKGCKNYTYIRILEDLGKQLNVDIELETK